MSPADTSRTGRDARTAGLCHTGTARLGFRVLRLTIAVTQDAFEHKALIAVCAQSHIMRFPASESEMQDYLDFAVKTTSEAGQLTLRYFRTGITVETKRDGTPVTVADREAEVFIRDRIRENYPEHTVRGEEFGTNEVSSDYEWLIDPIDGTKSFVNGIPLYTTLLALLYRGTPVLGVVHCPPLAETVAAVSGLGCTLNGRACHVSSTERLEDAMVNVTDYRDLYAVRPDLTERLISTAKSCRAWGDAYGYVLVATGRADVMVDAVMSPWDIAPLGPIITEAGGVLGDLDGRPDLLGTSSVACNRRLFGELFGIS
ncbi:MAG: histidinol phosphate phosphatase [Candidatus Thorarchaeota archaeon]|nr:histidinol phosphate phosphatase [Candidatus Thorarchaeota archaeon]